MSRQLLWPLVAGIGVLLLAYDGEEWVGNLPGVLFACGAGAGWACYILLTKKVGNAFKGLEGLSMSLIVAAIVATPFGFASAAPHLTGYGLVEMAGLGTAGAALALCAGNGGASAHADILLRHPDEPGAGDRCLCWLRHPVAADDPVADVRHGARRRRQHRGNDFRD